MRTAILLASASLGALASSTSAAAVDWDANARAAAAWARQRQGTVAFALIDDHGVERGVGARRHWLSASTLKPILMTVYLRQEAVRDRPLTLAERRLLSPMIRASANDPASRLVLQLGAARIEAFAREHAGLGSFRLALPTWGSSTITALGYARFMRRIDYLLPPRQRAYARSLLRTIVARQRWGVARVAPDGWTLLFKGGWRAGSRGGRIVNQVARLERGRRVVTLAIHTDGDPSHDYGTRTVEGVARRLLAGL
ncbi:MAG TPA: hypothetical protein VHB30_04070 [Solirubrobacteraceae bacterium]|nr:hypothetical protein [Solirubrobacteraceae bacterium]